jgi:hypothetical protein
MPSTGCRRLKVNARRTHSSSEEARLRHAQYDFSTTAGPIRTFNVLEFCFKPDYDSYERQGGAFHKQGSRLLGNEAHEYHSSQVVAGLTDVTWTEQKPISDEQFEHLKRAFGLQFIKVE